MLDTATGEVEDLTLMHEGNQVREFYSSLPQPVLVGIEAGGSMPWFLNLMEQLGIECRVGHPAQIRAAEPRKQKHDRRDAELILKLLAENRFPAIWLPNKEQLDLRALLLHRHQWVRMRTRVQTALQAIALANGLRRGPIYGAATDKARFRHCRCCPTHGVSAERAAEDVLGHGSGDRRLIKEVAEQAESRSAARRLMTHPGVGPVTALATEVFLGDPRRFADGQSPSQLCGDHPARILQRRTAAARWSDQTRKSPAAVSLG